MSREIANVSKAVERDAVVVRLGDDRLRGGITFDFHQFGAEDPLFAYRLWMPQPIGPAYLVPTAGENLFVRFDPHGLEVRDEAPFTDDFDRHRGLTWGSAFLSVATKGWF
jgi:hypothetical protein